VRLRGRSGPGAKLIQPGKAMTSRRQVGEEHLGQLLGREDPMDSHQVEDPEIAIRQATGSLHRAALGGPEAWRPDSTRTLQPVAVSIRRGQRGSDVLVGLRQPVPLKAAEPSADGSAHRNAQPRRPAHRPSSPVPVPPHLDVAGRRPDRFTSRSSCLLLVVLSGVSEGGLVGEQSAVHIGESATQQTLRLGAAAAGCHTPLQVCASEGVPAGLGDGRCCAERH
jgi:hypothetical protein